MASLQMTHLAAFVGFPETQLASLIATPTTELVQALLSSIEQKSIEHERLAAERLRLEVELESAVRSTESKEKALRSNHERIKSQVTELEQQISTERNAKISLQTEITKLKDSTSSSALDLTALQKRITSLETSNRDTLSLLESKTKAHDSLAQELSAKHQKTVELRREVSDLEDKVRAASTEATNTRLRESAFVQEVEALKRNNEYFEQELKTKSSEYAKFRKEKSTRITELQRQNEDDGITIDGLRRSENVWRGRASELEQKVEEYISQVQQAKEELVRQEESFRLELDTANRLHELMKERAETEKERAQFLQNQYDTVQDEAREEFAKIQEELQTAQNDKDNAERRVSELEVQVERLEAETANLQTGPTLTPRFNGSGPPVSAPRTPQRGMSPTMMTGSAIKGNLSYTQLVSDNHELRRKYGHERKRNEELASQVDQIMQDLDRSRPGMEQLSAENDRLQADIGEMSLLVESAGKERDLAKREARSMESQVAGLTKEGEILRQQLRDLSSQVKVLLLEVNEKDQGFASFTAEERLKLEQLAASDSDTLPFRNDTDHFISKHLVTFRRISELQEQNVKMLRISRELGDKMEGDEARQKESQAAQDHEEVLELRQKYENCRDEIKSLITQSQSYIRERDIFRRMLAHRGQLPAHSELNSMFGESVNGDTLRTPARNVNLHQSVEMSPSSKEIADFNKLIKEMQNHFDSYKSEAFEERRQLKDQVQGLTHKNGELRNDLARRSGEVTLASERYDMLQGNYDMLKNENAELKKRSQAVSDRAAQQDLRVQTVAEDLVESKSLIESMRKETANLKAEKDFWKTVEKRLNEDNQSLVTERDRLNTLNMNMQNLLNEKEHSEGEVRRKLQAQVETLESDIQTTTRRLTEAEEESKREVLRREYASQEAQTRIDDLLKSLGSTREDFAATKATRDQLQIRVDELTIELRSAEERLQVLMSTPATEKGASQDQDLALQVSELNRDLELANNRLDSAREEIEQYRAISQNSEEQLESLNESHDQFRKEMDNVLEQKNAKVKELEQVIEKMRTEVEESATEVEGLRIQKDSYDRTLQEQRSQLELEINRLKDAGERAEAAAQLLQEDVKAQGEIARQAQENYNNELQKHAEASNGLQALRAEANQLRLELVELRTAKEAAEITLSQGEETWADNKTRFEQEIAEIRSRRDDLNEQVKLLHGQLEKRTNEVLELQRSRSSGAILVTGIDAAQDAGLASSKSNDVAGLQEIIKFLRRDKEILDIQYEQASRENKRQRQQLEHLQSQLDETRLKLSQQRKAEEDRERSRLDHNKLLDTIQELNLFRESNVTLRLEKTQTESSLASRVRELGDLQDELQSLHAKVQELEDLREAQQEDLRMAREARERFEQRYHDVLSKTDAIDPADFEALKEQIATMQTQNDELEAQATSLKEQVDKFPAELEKSLTEANEAAAQSRAKLIDQAKNKNRENQTKIKERDQSLQQAMQESEQLRTDLSGLRAELEQVKVAKLELERRLQQAESFKGSDTSTAPVQTSSKNTDDETSGLRDQLIQALTRADTHAAETIEVRKQLETVQARVSQLETEISAAKVSLDESHARVTQLQPLADQVTQLKETTSEEDLGQLKQELLLAIQDVTALREGLVAPEERDDQQMLDQVARQPNDILAELIARHEKRLVDTQDAVAMRLQSMKADFESQVANSKSAAREELQNAHEQSLQTLRREHQQEVEQLNIRHKLELEELQRRVAAAPTSDATEAQATFTPDNFTQDQARELLKNNKFVRELVIKNISTKVTQAKEQVAKEYTEKMVEAEAKAKTSRDEAVKIARDQGQQMEQKKQLVKLNMAQNQMRMAQIKVEYVKTAATETPQKAVGEVWEVAKDVKPPPPPSPVTVTPTKPTGPGLGASVHASSQPSTAQQAIPVAPAMQQNDMAQSRPQQAAPAMANPFAGANETLGGATPASPFVAAVAATQAQRPQSPFVADAADAANGPASIPARAEVTADNAATDPAAAAPTVPAIPRPASQQSQIPGAGRGNGRGNIVSALPVPGGRGQPAQRGQPTQRGRGRGSTRGGTAIPQPGGQIQGQQQGGGQVQGQAQGQGPTNPGAKQFVPQKRGLDASDHAGSVEKKQRGGKS